MARNITTVTCPDCGGTGFGIDLTQCELCCGTGEFDEEVFFSDEIYEEYDDIEEDSFDVEDEDFENEGD